MNVVYAVTRNFYDKILPSIYSLREHNPDVKIYVIAEDDSVGIPVEVINISDQKFFTEDNVNYFNRYTYINLLKVCYPSLLPCDKVLHLDADTIVCDSLEQFWETDLTDKWVAAVDEVRGNYHPFGVHYYNMGVALINLDQMRKDKVEPIMVDYLNSKRQPWADQDAWNEIGLKWRKFVEVDVRYNENFATGQTDNPAIVHYCGIQKWYECRHNMPRVEYLLNVKNKFGLV